MKIRAFNKVLNSCRNKAKTEFDLVKLAALPEETRHNLAMFIIRNRGPVIEQFITPLMDKTWLNSMGYLYKTKGAKYTFIHTGEHTIK